MNQIVQFIKWLGRDFLSMFKNITVSGVFALAAGAQAGSAVIAMGTKNDEVLSVLAVSMPITVALYIIGLFVGMQWDRFKQDQQRVLNNLK